MINTNTEKPLLMITNDDGVAAPGIKVLTNVALRYADVVVVAPDGSNSGKSHSFTVMDELRVRKCTGFGKATCYAVKGTPVDCAKLGFYGLVPRAPPPSSRASTTAPTPPSASTIPGRSVPPARPP